MTTSPQAEPVALTGRLDGPLSRWLWLIKWLLIIPHVVVLALLGIAAFLAGVLAFFAILFTGRFPRSLFDFNLRVMRWMWRVEFYSYMALGTDRYPPFSLAVSPNYPANLEVEYPEQLGRFLPLVKWLLAIPHFIILSFMRGNNGFGLMGILALVAGVTMLFTGRYPRPVFAFMMGMNLWYYRVVAYVLLMTDRYPPFRLDVSEQA